MIVALAGGVGGAKLAAGLARVLQPEDLVIAVNTGDDFEHLGVHVSPDLDTVMYTLAGIANPETGWGQAGETWSFMEALAHLGGPAWFRLGDRDLATNVERTRRLRAGETLSELTRELCARLGVWHAVVPMSDEPVRTVVHTDRGALEFQHYFVRDRCEPRVAQLEYCGADAARPSPALRAALGRGDLAGVLICPSNPYLSIAPILAVPGVREAIAGRAIAVSPIIAGRAVKGPAAKIMQELGIEPSALEVARYYRGVARAMVIDRSDAPLAAAIEALGIGVVLEDTLMTGDADRERLARACLAALERS
ncbi:MAG TPA: 2-phospho-L-lactate transferase [Burkholderiales bacterium]|nr:2-phospho-L-lactate transferase [Burkholderiales bacterium]